MFLPYLSVCSTAEGRQLMAKHGGVTAILTIQALHSTKESINHLSVKIFALLEKDPKTRLVLYHDTAVVTRLFQVLEGFREREDIVQVTIEVMTGIASGKEAFGCDIVQLYSVAWSKTPLLTLSTEAKVRETLLSLKSISPILSCLERFPTNHHLISNGLTALQLLASTNAGCIIAIHDGAVFHTVSILLRFTRMKDSEGVISASISLLDTLTEHRLGRAHLKASDGLHAIINGLKALWGK